MHMLDHTAIAKKFLDKITILPDFPSHNTLTTANPIVAKFVESLSPSRHTPDEDVHLSDDEIQQLATLIGRPLHKQDKQTNAMTQTFYP
jgi:hypothetical protein